MNLFVVFAALSVFIISSSWNVDCAPTFQSTNTFTSSMNGGPPITYTVTNNNGRITVIDYTVNGRPATQQEIDDLIAQGHGTMKNSYGMHMPGNNMGMGPMGPPMGHMGMGMR